MIDPTMMGGAPGMLGAGPPLDPMSPMMGQQAQSLLPPPPLPPPPPRRVRSEPPTDKKELEKIQKYVASFAKASRSYVQQKEDYWNLLSRLKDDVLNSYQWRQWRRGEAAPPSQRRKEVITWLQDKEPATRSNYAHSLTYALDWSADTAWSAIFDGPQWCTIVDQSTKPQSNQQQPNPLEQNPLDPNPQQQQNQQISSLTLSDMVAKLLTDKLEHTQIHSRVTDLLSCWVDKGTCVVKTSLLRDRIPVTQIISVPHPFLPNQFIEKRIDGWETLREDPLAEMIPLHRFLPDPRARHNDPQRWDMVGHWVEITYDEIIDRFKRGVYGNVLPLAKFKERWDELKQQLPEAEIDTDQDSLTDSDERAFLRVWELHGKVPTNDGLKEGLFTLITTSGQDDPSDGLLVRMEWGPVLFATHYASRPFALAHFYQRQGPFGVGMLEQNEKLLYLISQFIGFSQDIAMRCAGPATAMSRQMKEYIDDELGGTVPPGSNIPLGIGEEKPVALHLFDLSGVQLVDNIIKLLLSILDRRTMSEVAQGMGSGVETAHEADILNTQSMKPTEVRTARFARALMTPMLNQALGFICQYCEGDQTITMQGNDGKDVSYTITEQDLRDSKFVAYPVLAKQDHARIVRARALLDMLNNAKNYNGLLQQMGWAPDWGVPLKEASQLLDIDKNNQFLHRISDFEQQLIQQIQQLEQQLQMVMSQKPPGANGNGAPPPESMDPGLRRGGPLGGRQDDFNLELQHQQMNPAVNMQGGFQQG